MKHLKYYLLFIYATIAALTIIYFDGTGDSGDSIMHFLFAKYAPHHPELFFDHWAKPVFVLLASPFAQFGFVGIKIFNSIATLFTIFFTYKIAEKLQIRNAILIPIILICIPVYYVLTFSGLTEPLFALFIALGIYWLITEKYIAGCILLSFLPFVRSEGLIILGVIVLFLIVKRKWKLIPLLAIGHLVYSFSGYFVYHDLLWVFRKIPYAHLSSIYGKGELTHFAQKLFYFFGLPLYILFCLGLIELIVNSIRKKSNYPEQILFLILFMAFFVAHSLFWYLGIFGSMGLTRVFICVIPIMAIISLHGFNFLAEDLLGKWEIPRKILKISFVLFIVIFPFTTNHSGIHFDRDMKLHEDQELAGEVKKFVDGNGWKESRIITNHPYLLVALDIDPFSPGTYAELNKDVLKNLKSGDLVIWDNWFSKTEVDIQREELDRNDQLVSFYNFNSLTNKNEIIFSLYRKSNTVYK